jgi:hypothetical protein
MDRHVRLDPNFANRMRAQKEQKKREELERKVEAESRRRRAEEDGFDTAIKDAQSINAFEELKALASQFDDYLNPAFMPHDRERLRREWFKPKHGQIAPEPDSESWRQGYARGIVSVFRAVDRP